MFFFSSNPDETNTRKLLPFTYFVFCVQIAEQVLIKSKNTSLTHKEREKGHSLRDTIFFSCRLSHRERRERRLGGALGGNHLPILHPLSLSPTSPSNFARSLKPREDIQWEMGSPWSVHTVACCGSRDRMSLSHSARCMGWGGLSTSWLASQDQD